MNIIVINMIAEAINDSGICITPFKDTFHKSVVRYGNMLVMYYLHNGSLRKVVSYEK